MHRGAIDFHGGPKNSMFELSKSRWGSRARSARVLRAEPEPRARSARVLRAKPEPRARSARELRAKPDPRAQPEINRGEGSGEGAR